MAKNRAEQRTGSVPVGKAITEQDERDRGGLTEKVAFESRLTEENE